MCHYYIHFSLQGIRLDTIRPKEILSLLSDIRLIQCNQDVRCRKAKMEQLHLIPDPSPCRAHGCNKRHRDGVHVSKQDFLKLIGTQLAEWLFRTAKETRKTLRESKERKHE